MLANRRALAYVLGYGVHCWELFAMRSWLVAFLAFSLSRRQAGHAVTGLAAPTSVATVSGLVAMAASIGGNELCLRFGRPRVVGAGDARLGACAAVGFGFTAPLAYGLVAALSLIYPAVIQLDSAALTAGAVEAALPDSAGRLSRCTDWSASAAPASARWCWGWCSMRPAAALLRRLVGSGLRLAWLGPARAAGAQDRPPQVAPVFPAPLAALKGGGTERRFSHWSTGRRARGCAAR